MSIRRVCPIVAVFLTLAAFGLFSLSVRSIYNPTPHALAADLTSVPLDVWQYLPLVMGGLKSTPTPSGPHTIQLPAVATWRLFSTGSSYGEGLRGANLLVDGPGYPFAEVGQYHTHWDQYYIEKDFLAFDTSTLPASASVLSATLVISGCTAVQADRPFQVEFYQATVGEAVTAGDWNAYGGNQVASFPGTACRNGPVVLALDPAVVQRALATRLALITDHIRLGQEPPRDQGDTAQIATARGSVSLRVTYKER